MNILTAQKQEEAKPKYLRLLLCLFLLAPLAAKAQLPPGTIDTTAAPQPDPSAALRTQATDALDKQDYPTALKLLSTLAEQNPKDARTLYDLGFTEDALDHEPEATAAYQKSIAADATYFEPHLALGLLLARTGKLSEAHAELAAAVTLTTPDGTLKARAYRALARLDQTTDPAAASDDLLEALKLSPESVEDALLAGELAEAAHDLPAAEGTYRRILATHADDPAVTAALAHLLLSLKRAPEAEPILTSALVRHPGDPTLTSQLAATDAAEGKTAEAIALIEELHTASPTNPNLTRLLAHLYSDNKQPEKAAPLYADLLSLSPQDASLLADQGATLLQLHNYVEAQNVLTRAISNPTAFANPVDLGSAAENLAFAASHNNHPDIVLQAVAVRAKVLPDSAASLFLAATANDSLHHVKQASELYKQFLAIAAGKYPDQEWEASHRLIALQHMR
ncbi:tetratricopeptide repeat protein [Granulicella arctica]|uniref:Putative Zn-dependent protease n=1 Tax=Granulicella arctica TaxID=940613 RepID=A0A7Y9PIT2_9BACT|nr:tetratricopeptide repeat protein [Granulicella arctica]NYF80677.1 putative Zn-dependent protease [Granulicella arctica]